MLVPRTSSQLLRLAHGDAWQVLGRIHEPHGGGIAEVPGARLMASGLPHAQWNNGDVYDVGALDLDQVRGWYLQRGVPWGLRVPAGAAFQHGRHLFRKRLMGLRPQDLRPPADVPGLELRPAGIHDVDTTLAIDVVAFDSDPETERPWVTTNLTAPEVTVVLALLDGEPVGTAYSLQSDLWAGPCAYLCGVAVLPHARGTGVTAAMVAWVSRHVFDRGAELAHLHPDGDDDAALYARLGFVEVEGLDVYVEL